MMKKLLFALLVILSMALNTKAGQIVKDLTGKVKSVR